MFSLVKQSVLPLSLPDPRVCTSVPVLFRSDRKSPGSQSYSRDCIGVPVSSPRRPGSRLHPSTSSSKLCKSGNTKTNSVRDRPHDVSRVTSFCVTYGLFLYEFTSLPMLTEVNKYCGGIKFRDGGPKTNISRLHVGSLVVKVPGTVH